METLNENNKQNSPLTIFSSGGVLFFFINIFGNFGTVFVDQSFWQAAIASRPSATYRSYVIAGLAWFAVPFCFASAMSIGAHAMRIPVSLDESRNGLLPAAVLTEMYGCSGAVTLLLIVVMSVISTGSSEQVAVTSLLSYDIYRTYIAPKASSITIMKI